MNRTVKIALSGFLLAFCVLFRADLERSPISHILVLLPCLAMAGGLIAGALGRRHNRLTEANANALTLVAVVTVLFWMLPRYIDLSLVDPWTGAAKFLTLPVLVGAPLAIAWRRTHPFLRGFIKANGLSMLGVLAYLYTHAPVRICNSYLVSEQISLGWAFLYLAIALAVFWTLPLFLPPAARSVRQSRELEGSAQ